MLKINLDADINNIAYLSYMKSQEAEHEKDNVIQSNYSAAAGLPHTNYNDTKKENP